MTNSAKTACRISQVECKTLLNRSGLSDYAVNCYFDINYRYHDANHYDHYNHYTGDCHINPVRNGVSNGVNIHHIYYYADHRIRA